MNCVTCGTLMPPATTKPRKFCRPACRKSHYRKEDKADGRNAWFSPAEIVDAARRVMGDIDLDPASCKRANEIVRATRYYTRADNGLTKPWHGRVWLNPPYDNLAPQFFRRFREAHIAGDVPTACLLFATHHLTTRWFQETHDFSTILCLPSRRLRFTGYATKTQPMHGSVILGAGVDPDLFRQEFNIFGSILEISKAARAA